MYLPINFPLFFYYKKNLKNSQIKKFKTVPVKLLGPSSLLFQYYQDWCQQILKVVREWMTIKYHQMYLKFGPKLRKFANICTLNNLRIFYSQEKEVTSIRIKFLLMSKVSYKLALLIVFHSDTAIFIFLRVFGPCLFYLGGTKIKNKTLHQNTILT